MRMLTLLVCLALTAQDPPVFKSDVSLVTFTATITDASGHYVRGLKKEDVGLFEDGVRQNIAMFRFEPEPVSVGIVFDTSGSMRNKIQDVADAVSHFGATAERDDEIFLMEFAGHAKVMMDFTNDRARLAAAVSDLRAGGATILYDAVSEALDKVAKGKHRKQALLVITDGEDTSSFTKLDYLLQQARESEVLVYCIGIGATAPKSGMNRNKPGISVGSIASSLPSILLGGRGRVGATMNHQEDTVDMEVLNALAEAGGARAWQIHTKAGGTGVDRIDQVTQEISAELRQQYFIGYYPSNAKRDGTFRKIEVTSALPEYTIRTRHGYYAPK